MLRLRPSKSKDGPTPAVDSGPKYEKPYDPYAAAKAEFNEVFGAPLVQAKNWRLVAIIAIVIALVAVIALSVAANRSRFIPYVVEVNQQGEVANVAMANQAGGAAGQERIVRAFLHRFIVDARRVSFDPGAQKDALNRTFTMIASGTVAHGKMTQYFQQDSPFERGRTQAVDVEVGTILQTGENSWRITWRETSRDPRGQQTGREAWQASVSTAFNPPTNEMEALMNPLGLFIVDFDWRRELVQ